MTHTSSRPPEGHGHGEADSLYRVDGFLSCTFKEQLFGVREQGLRRSHSLYPYGMYDLMGLVLHHRKMAF